MIVSNSGYMPRLSQTNSTEHPLNIAAAAGNHLPLEATPSAAVQISEAARAEMLQETTDFVDFTDQHGLFKLGLMALGKSTLQEWSAKGLEISDEAVIAAGKAFQDGFKKMVEKSGPSLAGSSLALNKHQILINTQDVPDWFTQEYKAVLSSQANKEMKAAFEQGELFFTSKPSTSKTNALASYAAVLKNS